MDPKHSIKRVFSTDSPTEQNHAKLAINRMQQSANNDKQMSNASTVKIPSVRLIKEYNFKLAIQGQSN